jgi:hypothetical protein
MDFPFFGYMLSFMYSFIQNMRLTNYIHLLLDTNLPCYDTGTALSFYSKHRDRFVSKHCSPSLP